MSIDHEKLNNYEGEIKRLQIQVIEQTHQNEAVIT